MVMEKEMKKLLLVAVSVGVFLLVTITVAIVALTPKVQTQETSFSSSVPLSHHGRNIPDIMSNVPMQVEIPVTPDFRRNDEVEILEPPVSVVADRNDGDRLTIQIPRPSSAAVPDISNVTAAPAARQPASVAAQPAARQTPPAAQSQPAARPTQAAPAASRPAATATTTARPATRTINDFWIQTGAFSAMVRAEDAKERLESKGLVSLIETREIDGRTWYRVRLGPYTSEREANHWLAIVKEIDGFGGSQVRQTVRQQ
jgi:DedD protein